MRRLSPVAIAVSLAALSCSDPVQQPVSTSSTTTVATTITTGASTTSSTTTSTTTTSAPQLGELERLSYELISELAFPVQLVARPGEDLAYVVLKGGLVLALDSATGAFADAPVLDIAGRVRDVGEQGLLAMALHPTDANRFYLHYSARSDGRTIVAEYRLDSPLEADPESERVLLSLAQPAANHNGGMLQFTDTGVLLVGLGDGGGANDQFGNGQNAETLLGGLVAIDVDGDAEPSLFAMGLRNPWRFWIDRELMYVADVGQNAFEEVSVASVDPGHNFGWPVTEGLHCFRPSSGCETTGFVLPVVEVSHGDAGTCSITGGVVYRGSLIPELDGHFFYSDFCGAYLRSFRYTPGTAEELTDWTDQVGRTDGGVVGFGVDGEGEMYVMSTRAMYRVTAVRADALDG